MGDLLVPMKLEHTRRSTNLSKKDLKEGRIGRSTFDIVAGTSIGAINAAVLVSYVVENQTYEGSPERLVDFWNYLSKDSMVETNPFLNLGGIIGMQLIERLPQEKQQGGTFQLKSLQYLEYQMSFILIDLHETANFTISTIRGIVIATNL